MRRLLAFPLIAAVLGGGSALADDPPTVFELRTYHAHPGKLDALNARFRDHTHSLFQKHGMTPVGYWTPTDEASRAYEVFLENVAVPAFHTVTSALTGEGHRFKIITPGRAVRMSSVEIRPSLAFHDPSEISTSASRIALPPV